MSVTKECAQCQTEFQARNPRGRYCSPSCSRKAANERQNKARAAERAAKVRHCEHCGDRIPAGVHGKSVTCSEECRLSRTKQMDNARCERWRKDNPERFLASMKRWRDANPDKANEGRRKWAENNRERTRENAKRWHAENPTKQAEYSHERRARQMGAFVMEVSRQEIHDRDDGLCYLCGEHVPIEEMHLEHLIPLIKGGTHEPNNTAVSCAPCNLFKHARIVPQGIQKRAENMHNALMNALKVGATEPALTAA